VALIITEIKVSMKDEKSGSTKEYSFKDGKIRISKDGKEEVVDTKMSTLLCEQMNAMLGMALARM
jgi:hypothetical protein